MMSQWRPAIRVGLFLGVAEVAYGLLFRIAGFHHTSAWAWVFYLMLPVATWAAQRATARGTPRLRWWAAVGVGTAAVAIGAAMYCFKVWAYNRFVSDSLLVDVRAEQLSRARAAGLDDLALASRMETVDALLTPAVFSLTVWVQLVVVGAICAALTGTMLRMIRRSDGAPTLRTERSEET